MKKAKHKIGDKVTVVRVVQVYGGKGSPLDIHHDFIKSIDNDKITLKSGFVFNATSGYKVGNRDTFIKEIRYTA